MNARASVNILLVDDQPAKLLSYEAILGDLGHNLIKASSGREALEILLHTDITVVLMDVSMPELDGFELAELIRQHPRFQRTAIIFVSAVHLSDLDQLKGYESGAVDYVSVPVIPEILRAKVRVFVELYRQREEAERLNRELEQRVEERTAELRAYAARLRESEERLREADRRKDEFLALLAHELRNPLAPVHNAVEIMRLREYTDSELVWCRDVIERQVSLLTRLVDDLLDVSRITRGKINLQRQPVDLATVIAAAVETSRPLIDARHHTLDIVLPEHPVHVDGDIARLTQVIANLLNNSAKYQNDGGFIEVRVEKAGMEVALSVTDRGLGIEPHRLPRIFELFSQESVALDRSHGGLGIGLWLVRKLVEMHGGNVRVGSDGKGRGSTFTVRLPLLARVPETRRPPEPAEIVTDALRVLVVDDNRDAAESLAMLLRLHGHEVVIANDGPAAVELAVNQQPAVVLLDIGLPGMDGYEVCRRIRQHGFDDMLVVAMTGYGQEKDRQRSHDAGFDTHTVKPVDPPVLQRLLAGRRTRSQPVIGA
jgi:signal transduction histidine kinase